MTDEMLHIDRQPPIFHISFNRPEARNALNEDLRRALREALNAAEADSEARCVLLTGEGPDFCAGADIKQLGQRTMLGSAWAADRLDTLVESLSKPVVAALHGNTLGGGFELSLACTMRLAASDLRVGLPEIKLGVFPALGATQRLPRIIGEAIALDLILTGRTIDADQALRWGIVSKVVPTGELRAAAWELALVLARRPPIAMRVATDAVRRSSDMSRSDGIEFERRLFGLVCGTEDKSEGVTAWIEKRSPEFRGR